MDILFFFDFLVFAEIQNWYVCIYYFGRKLTKPKILRGLSSTSIIDHNNLFTNISLSNLGIFKLLI